MDDHELGQLRLQARALYERLREAMRARWQRDLPLEELLFDRWERAHSLGFGEGANIYHNSYVYGDVRVGKKTWIGPFTLLDGTGGGLEIGDYCAISTGVQIYTHDSWKWAVTGGRVKEEHAPVRVGDCCYLGSQTVVTKGVTIGDHCVIGSCSLVNRDIPPRTVAFGVPCRPVGRLLIGEGGEVSWVKLNPEGADSPGCEPQSMGLGGERR